MYKETVGILHVRLHNLMKARCLRILRLHEMNSFWWLYILTTISRSPSIIVVMFILTITTLNHWLYIKIAGSLQFVKPLDVITFENTQNVFVKSNWLEHIFKTLKRRLKLRTRISFKSHLVTFNENFQFRWLHSLFHGLTVSIVSMQQLSPFEWQFNLLRFSD